jgi:hypothetical protein
MIWSRIGKCPEALDLASGCCIAMCDSNAKEIKEIKEYLL